MNIRFIVCGTIIGVGVLASNVEALDIYATGSSSALRLIRDLPLSVCDNAWPITHFESSDRNMQLLQCRFSGVDINFHYSARGSADGVYPVDDHTGGPRSKGQYNGKGAFAFIKHSNPAISGCGVTVPVSKTFYDVDSASVITQVIQENSTCINPPKSNNVDWSPFLYDQVPTHFGFSDVQFTSFGQVSPGGSEPADPAPNVTEHRLMVVPFSIVVQNSVRRVDAAGNNIGPIHNLTQTQIEQIFSRRVRDWKELGYAVTNDLAGTQAVPSGPHTIRLCLREYGSGAKAAFDNVLMKEEADEWSVTTSATVFYSAANSDVRDCMNDVPGYGVGLYGKIGYIDSFLATGTPAYITPSVAGTMIWAHPVSINGFRGVDATVTDPVKATARPKVLKGLRCGHTEFWTNLEAYTKTAGTGDVVRDSFIARMVSDAQNTAVIENLPANWAFEAPAYMLAFKAEDRSAPDHDNYLGRAAEYDSQCRGFYASPNP